MTATDTANASTPSATSAASSPAQSLTVRSPLAVNIPNPSPIPDAVTGRVYGTPGGIEDLIYSLPAGQGLPAVKLAGSGFPSPIACGRQTSTIDSTISMHCTSGGVIVAGATATGTVTATDTANASTPAATTFSDSGSQLQSATTTQITVDPEILIPNQSLITPICGTVGTPCALSSGQQSQPYSVLSTCQAPLGTGTCGGTTSPNNAAAQYTWTATSNNITGTAFTTAMPVLSPTGDATFTGTPTISGAAKTVTIGVADNGNFTTPSCTTAATCSSEVFTTQILPSGAFVGANSTNAIGRFDTSAGAAGVTEVGSAVTLGGAGTTPNYVAVSPNGTYTFIADPTNHQVFIYNTLSGVTNTVSTGLTTAAGDTHAITVIPKVVPTTGVSPDDVNVIVANAGTDNLQVIDADPADLLTFGTVTGAATFTSGSHAGAGPVDLKVAPTFFVVGVRLTHGYVLREGGDEVCVFDVEPSSANVGHNISAAHSPNTESCIPLGSASGVIPKFIDVSPDGLYAFVTETNGSSAGALKIIDTNSNSATFETLIRTIDLTPPTPVTLGTGDGTLTAFSGTFTPVPITPGSLEVVAGSVTGSDNGSGSITGTGISSGTVNYTTGAVSVTFTTAPTTGTLIQVSNVFATNNPAGVRVSPDGQTVWVAGEDTGRLLGFETALVGSRQFSMVASFSTPAPAFDKPIGIAFRSDGAFGLATLSAATPNGILPFTSNAGTPVTTTGVTTPSGIDHIPNAVPHIVTATLPAATHGAPYASSIVANGSNKYFTFTDLTAGPNSLSGLGFTLSSDGQVTSAGPANSYGTHNLTIQVTDQSKPVNDVVQKTISLTIS